MVPVHGVFVPVMGDGWAGREGVVTASVCDVPLPQPFKGVTEILPDPAPTVTVIELVEPPAVCDHPAGNVHK